MNVEIVMLTAFNFSDIRKIHTHSKAMATSEGEGVPTFVDPIDKKGSPVQDVERGEVSNVFQHPSSEPPYSIFTQAEKIWIITLLSIGALISPFGATLYYPVLNELSKVLHVTPTMINISITTYMVRFQMINSQCTVDMDRLHKLLRRLSSEVSDST
jgi:hypothetical protein